MNRSVLWCLAVLFQASVLHAQTASGTLQGTVYDPSQAVVNGAHVTVTDQQTHISRNATTDEHGFFQFRALESGVYSIKVSQTGFTEQVVTNIPLQVAEVHTMNLTLKTGAVEQSINVEGSAVQLQVTDTSLSQVIDEQRVTELPLNGRNVLQLMSLSAGAVTSAKASATERQGNYGPGVSVGGQRDNTNVVLIDGIEVSGMELNNYPLAIPSLDSVQEFRVQTSNYSAEFGGNSGAVINIATKRGGNVIHGTVFEFLRNNDIDARNFFSASVSPLHRNQFGVDVGGPLWLPKVYNGRNKTFWQFSYEGIRQANEVSASAVVPTLAERSGNFAGTGTTVVDPVTRIPFPNDVIPSTRFDAVGQKLLSEYPLPNSTNPAANYYGSPAQDLDNDLFSGRIDQRVSASDDLFARFTINQPKQISPGATAAFSGYNQIQQDWNLQVSLGNIWVISPHIVNETNLGFVRFQRGRGSQAGNLVNYVQQDGIQGFDPPPNAWGAPQVSPAGLNSVGYGSGNAVFTWISQSMQVVDNLSIEHGPHSFKTGFTFNRKLLDSTQFGSANGAYTFSGIFSALNPVQSTTAANSVADVLLGDPSAFTVQTGPYTQRFRYENIGAYAQDDWKVSPNFTVNLGIRWEYFGKPYDLHNQIATFNLNTGQQVLAGTSNLPSSLVYPQYHDFSPRIGFAWRAASRLSIRGAYGIFYTPEVINSFRNLGFQNPFGTTYTLSVKPANPAAPVPLISADAPLANASPAVNFATVLGIDPHFKDGYVSEWNVSLQYLLTANTVFEAAYRGSKSTHLSTELNFDQTNPFPAQPPNFALIYPYPAFGTVNYFQSNGDATFDALTLRIEKRYSKGFTILGSYTWLKDLTDIDQTTVGASASPGNAYAPQTVTNLWLNRGFAVADRPQQLVISGLYDLPVFRDHKKLIGKIAGGWQAGVDATFASGSWLTPSSYGVSYTGSRASLIGNPNLPRSQRTINRWFNVADVINPAPGQLGTAGKGSIMGSGTNLWNIALLKNFYTTEKQRLEFRAELFNAFNHPQFDDPYVYPANNPTAGKITSASDYGYNMTERVIQFALKYYF